MSVMGYPVVRIAHRACGGLVYSALAMPGNKRDIKDALYENVLRDNVIFLEGAHPGIPLMAVWCECGEEQDDA